MHIKGSTSKASDRSTKMDRSIASIKVMILIPQSIAASDGWEMGRNGDEGRKRGMGVAGKGWFAEWVRK